MSDYGDYAELDVDAGARARMAARLLEEARIRDLTDDDLLAEVEDGLDWGTAGNYKLIAELRRRLAGDGPVWGGRLSPP